MAEIHIYSGPMASGKTSKLLKKLHEYSNIYKRSVLLISYTEDYRGIESGISTHMYSDYSIKVPLGKYVNHIKVKNLSEIPDVILHQYSIIGIDEAQFYPDLEVFVRRHHLNPNLKFYLAGLKFTAENKPFGQLNNLEDIATTSRKFHSICARCDPSLNVAAGFTSYIGRKDKDILIGGLDIYEPLCTRHYFNVDV